jgi:hypothetical protein
MIQRHAMPTGAPMITARCIHAHMQYAAKLEFAFLMLKLGVRTVA